MRNSKISVKILMCISIAALFLSDPSSCDELIPHNSSIHSQQSRLSDCDQSGLTELNLSEGAIGIDVNWVSASGKRTKLYATYCLVNAKYQIRFYSNGILFHPECPPVIDMSWTHYWKPQGLNLNTRKERFTGKELIGGYQAIINGTLKQFPQPRDFDLVINTNQPVIEDGKGYVFQFYCYRGNWNVWIVD